MGSMNLLFLKLYQKNKSNKFSQQNILNATHNNNNSMPPTAKYNQCHYQHNKINVTSHITINHLLATPEHLLNEIIYILYRYNKYNKYPK